MTVLSNVDLEKELIKGKNIRIYPLKIDNIKGSTYNLTASEFAWSITTKKPLNIVKNKIVIPANESALIATKEVIWTSAKIAGSYHSKVSIVSKGGGHIGTTLDPNWIGHSLITVHNHHTQELEIGVNDTFVSIMFHYLNRKTTFEQDNKPSQLDNLYKVIPQTEISPTAHDYFDIPWKSQPINLLEKMKSGLGSEYIELEKRNKSKFAEFKRYTFIVLTIISISFLLWLRYYFSTDKTNFIEFIVKFITDIGLSGIIITALILAYNKLK